MSDICLRSQLSMHDGQEEAAYIDLLVMESLLEIIIDSVVCDCA